MWRFQHLTPTYTLSKTNIAWIRKIRELRALKYRIRDTRALSPANSAPVVSDGNSVVLVLLPLEYSITRTAMRISSKVQKRGRIHAVYEQQDALYNIIHYSIVPGHLTASRRRCTPTVHEPETTAHFFPFCFFQTLTSFQKLRYATTPSRVAIPSRQNCLAQIKMSNTLRVHRVGTQALADKIYFGAHFLCMLQQYTYNK